MNEQEMQFADPDWKPTGQTSVQDEAKVAGTSVPQPVNSKFYNVSQSASASSYTQGYRSHTHEEQIPYISPVVQQHPVRARRRRSLWWVWLIVGIVFLAMVSNNFSVRMPGKYGPPPFDPPFSRPMPQMRRTIGDVSQIQINGAFGGIQVQVNRDLNSGEVVVTSGNPDVKEVQIVENPGTLSINAPVNSSGDVTVAIELPASQTALNLSADGGNNIEIDGYIGQLSTTTDGGTITLNNDILTDKSTITSQTGSIAMNEDNLSGQVQVSTGGSADINFGGTLDPHGIYQFSTDNGDINLALPADTSMQVQHSTGPGGFYQNEFSADTTGGLPRALLELQTNSGQMTIREQN